MAESVREQECLAMVWAVKSLWIYLEGKPFAIQTDWAPSEWLRFSMSGKTNVDHNL